MARLLAAELSQSDAGRETAQFVQAAFRRTLGREATATELAECAQFLERQQKLLGGGQLTTFETGAKAAVQAAASPEQRARENLVHVLLNHNDFVTLR